MGHGIGGAKGWGGHKVRIPFWFKAKKAPGSPKEPESYRVRRGFSHKQTTSRNRGFLVCFFKRLKRFITWSAEDNPQGPVHHPLRPQLIRLNAYFALILVFEIFRQV